MEQFSTQEGLVVLFFVWVLFFGFFLGGRVEQNKTKKEVQPNPLVAFYQYKTVFNRTNVDTPLTKFGKVFTGR